MSKIILNKKNNQINISLPRKELEFLKEETPKELKPSFFKKIKKEDFEW